MSAPVYDVVVVGGGMVGAALAAALGQAGFRVAVVEAEAAPPAPPREGFDPRVSAISRASQRFLDHLGAWAHIDPARLSPYREMRVWDAGAAGAIHFTAADLGEPDLGHIIENAVIQGALAAALDRLDTVTWVRPRTVRGLAPGAGGGRTVVLNDGTLAGRLVVGADGARSRVRHLAHIPDQARAYGHTALVATVRLGRGHLDTAWQRFLATGPLAFLPLPGDYCAIVWSAPPERVQELLALDPDGFHRELSAAFENRLGGVVASGPRAAYPLVRRHAARYVLEGLALVGDAAHSIHPLAGQGVNLGFLDAAVLAEVLTAARDEGEDWGERRVLRRYERRRRGHNLLVQGAMGGLKALFAARNPAVRLVRGLGLNLVDAAPPLKDRLMREAMGLTGDLPGWADGGQWPEDGGR